MAQNRIRELRTRKKLTQKQLAEAAGTSQQQIQRIEAGIQDVRFDLATRVSEALGEPLERVFPTTSLPLRRAKKKHTSALDMLADQDTVDELERAGLDMDGSQWTFVYRLRGGASGKLAIGRRDRDRLWGAVHENSGTEFVVFDAGPRRIALNMEHLIFCQFLFDPPNNASVAEDKADPHRAGYSLDVVLNDSAEVHNFRVEPDEVDLNDEEDPDPTSVQLQDVFFYLDSDVDRRVKFQDMDGETAFFRTSDVAMISVDLEAVEPKLLASTEVDGDNSIP